MVSGGWGDVVVAGRVQDLDAAVVCPVRYSTQRRRCDDGVDLRLSEWLIFFDSCWDNSRRVGSREPYSKNVTCLDSL